MEDRAAARIVALALLVFPAGASGGSLKPETLKAWDDYVEAATNRMQHRETFLWSEEDADRLRKVLGGEIVVSPTEPHIPRKVPSGLIHDWMGAAFISNAKIEDVFAVIRDYEHYPDFYAPTVVRSKAIVKGDSEDRYSMLLVNKPLIAKTSLDGEYRSTYVRVSENRWYSTTQSTRIQEITSGHKLPEDEGSGLLWRVFSVARFEARDGGVFIELEAMALSRDIPASLRWMIEPIVRRVARASLTISLHQTEAAIRSGGTLANHDSKPDLSFH